MLGLVDGVALAPLALAAALLSSGGVGVRAGLAVVAAAGVAGDPRTSAGGRKSVGRATPPRRWLAARNESRLELDWPCDKSPLA
jgi:hypothetical protein